MAVVNGFRGSRAKSLTRGLSSEQTLDRAILGIFTFEIRAFLYKIAVKAGYLRAFGHFLFSYTYSAKRAAKALFLMVK